MSAIFNFHTMFQRVEFQASLGLENRFCLTSSINQRAVKGKILKFVHEVRWSYILDKSAPEPPTAVLLQGILGSRKNWRRKTVEDVLRGVHINFLKAERSLHRWASEDIQRIHVAEEQAVESKRMRLKMLVIGYVALHPNIPSP